MHPTPLSAIGGPSWERLVIHRPELPEVLGMFRFSATRVIIDPRRRSGTFGPNSDLLSGRGHK
jgi:hypothetical protein